MDWSRKKSPCWLWKTTFCNVRLFPLFFTGDSSPPLQICSARPGPRRENSGILIPIPQYTKLYLNLFRFQTCWWKKYQSLMNRELRENFELPISRPYIHIPPSYFGLFSHLSAPEIISRTEHIHVYSLLDLPSPSLFTLCAFKFFILQCASWLYI